MRENWRRIEKKINADPLLVSSIVNSCHLAETMIDNECMHFVCVTKKFANSHFLKRYSIKPRPLHGVNGNTEEFVDEVARAEMNIEGIKFVAWMYVMKHCAEHDMILEKPFLKQMRVRLNPDENDMSSKLEFLNFDVVVREDDYKKKHADIREIFAIYFHRITQKTKHKNHQFEVFAVSLVDIDKTLRKLDTKTLTDLRKLLPKHYHEFLDVFDVKVADKRLSLREPDVDMKINLVEKDEKGNPTKIPWGPLYSMFRDELLILRKTLTSLLDKGFIRVSKSPAAAPVLFAKKPGEGLRFCVDYRALNRITRKDRYPLPLINETLQRVGRARWFTKLDIVQAFHQIRIAEREEWKTAFRTRYGLFEWLVTPFELANAPSTFQRYINWLLRDFLDDFVSAYIDDILIFTEGSLSEHREHVRKVFRCLREAGLKVEIDKCEFETVSTKYLGFLIEAGKGVKMDPEKVKAIQEWKPPTTVKGLRGFIGFANFYRRFIRRFSDIVAPLTDLTKKDVQYRWTPQANDAFEKLKDMFAKGPVLLQFSPDRETVIETDSSGYVVGGALMQYDDDGLLRPCAFFSKKNLPAECNYEIHDKELLAIVRCLKEWSAELRSVPRFQIITDHKSLEYFMTSRQLTERQIRWAELLSKFDFVLIFRPGKLNHVADALSRRDQDLPADASDERLEYRKKQLISPEMMDPYSVPEDSIRAFPAVTAALDEDKNDDDDTSQPTGGIPLEEQWETAKEMDPAYVEIEKAVKERAPRFPAHLRLHVSISECTMDNDELRWRGRRWVPDYEPLRTRIVQEMHDSTLSGHPGREVLSALVARQFFWPEYTRFVKRFVRNCDLCHAENSWRERRQELLKPLSVPTRIWREISVDFIVELPFSDDCKNLMVMTDRLGKDVILIPMKNIDADASAWAFVQHVFRRHGFPDAIVSNRDTQFVNLMWKRVCQLLRIHRRLSTAYHPQTDGSTERMNQNIETYIRKFTNYAQSDWVRLLPMMELSINNRDLSSTNVSPFFLEHGYNVDLLQLAETPRDVTENARTPVQKGELIVKKLADAVEWAQMSMAAAQQDQEEHANRRRGPSRQYNVGDKVWLNLRHISTDRPSEKLDFKHAKYTIKAVIDPLTYRLDTPPGIHNVFHVDRLHFASDDPLSSQRQTDYQPAAIVNDEGEEEYEVDEIVNHRYNRRTRRDEVLVRWTGYHDLCWESRSALDETAALDRYEARLASERFASNRPRRRRRRGGVM